MAATALLRLGALAGRPDLTQTGRDTLRSLQVVLEKAPSAAGQSLLALDFDLATTQEFAIIAGEDPREFHAAIATVNARFLPHKVVAPATPSQAAALAATIPLLADRAAQNGHTTTYLCENMTCQAPVVGIEALEAALSATSAVRLDSFKGVDAP
jgi:uncharacterized protein YyaL (SSP411 family)